jgi:hypothetical protein
MQSNSSSRTGTIQYASGLLSVINAKPKMRKMLVISCAAHVLILIWGSQVVASRLVFQNFFESMDAWLKWYTTKCCQFAPITVTAAAMFTLL